MLTHVSLALLSTALCSPAGSILEVRRGVPLCVLRGKEAYAWDVEGTGLAIASTSPAVDWALRRRHPPEKRGESLADDAWFINHKGAWILQTDLSRITPIHPTYPLSDLGIDIISHQDIGRPPPRNPKPIGPPRLGLVADFTSARTIVFNPARYPLGSKTKLDYSDVEEGTSPHKRVSHDQRTNLCYESRDGLYAGCTPVSGLEKMPSFANPHFAFVQRTVSSRSSDDPDRCALVVFKPSRVHVEEGWNCTLPQRAELWIGDLVTKGSPQGPVYRMYWKRTKVFSAAELAYAPFHAMWSQDGKVLLLITSDGNIHARHLDAAPDLAPELLWSKDNEPVLAVVWDQDHQRGYAFTATKYFALAEKLEVKPLAEPLRPIVQPADQWPLLSRCLEVVRKQRSP